MKTLKVLSMIDGQPTFDKSLPEFLKQCESGSVIQLLTPDEYLGLQQIRWWKGVLLPALSKDTGDSISQWETRLKLAVMPDDFNPEIYEIQGQLCARIPSITKLGKKKMNQMIEGSVSYCRDECGLQWATLPDPELRS